MRRNREEETQVCVDKAHLDFSISKPLNVLVIAMWDGPLMILADLGSLFQKHDMVSAIADKKTAKS